MTLYPARLRPVSGTVLCGVILSVCAARAAAADGDVDPRRLLPESAVAYVEVSQPSLLVDRATDPALWDKLDDVPQIEQALTSPQYAGARFVVGLLEARFNVRWPELVKDLAGGGIHVAVDPANDAVILVARGTRPGRWQEMHQALADLVNLQAANGGQPSPVKSQEYRGTTGWSFGPNENHVILGDTLVASNRAEALKAAIDRSLDPALRSLADVPEFVRSQSAADATEVVWARARLEPLRGLPPVQQALNNKSDNPVAELLLGGLLETFRHAPAATASLHLDATAAKLRVELARDASQTAPARAWYFAPSGGGAPPALRPRGTIATLAAYRDLAGLWAARDELFNDAVRTGLAQADSGLGLFFSGRDFGPEVLGEAAAGVRLVVASQEFAADQPVPALRLPAEAAVIELKNPDEFATQLLVAYQSIVGLSNLNAAQQGRPQFLLSNELHQGVQLWRATLLAAAETPREGAPVAFNFSPSCALYGKFFVVGTTAGIVRDTLDALAAGSAGEAPTADNFQLDIDAAAVAAALEANRDLLASQQMLSEGRTPEEAAARVAAGLDVLRLLGGAGLRIRDTAGSVTLELSVGAAPAP
jgi:hypothetical protein